MPVETEEGIEELPVRKVEIIVTDDGSIRIGSKEIYAKSTKRDEPYYSLEKVKECLDKVPSVVKFKERRDGKSDPQNLGIDEERAKNIIRDLKNSDYEKTMENRKPPADVYMPTVEIQEVQIKLYIKLCINENNMLIIISFHKSGMFPKRRRKTGRQENEKKAFRKS